MATTTIVRVISAHLAKSGRLAGVPLPVLEEVVDQAVRRISETAPMLTPASELDNVDFEACEQCGHLIDPEEPGQATPDSDGIYLCNACDVEASGATDDEATTGKGA